MNETDEFILDEKDISEWTPYYTLEKSIKLEQWGDGPWVDEPECVSFEYKGIECRIGRAFVWEGCNGDHLSMGNLNGYVQLPYNHPWIGKEGFDVPSDVHGGITFSGKIFFDPQEKEEWGIGFDCAHSRDIIPSIIKKMKEIREEFPHYEVFKGYPIFQQSYKDIIFVRNEVCKLAQQVIETTKQPLLE